MNEISQEFDGKVNIVKVDVDQAQQLAVQHGVRCVPTLLFLDNKK